MNESEEKKKGNAPARRVQEEKGDAPSRRVSVDEARGRFKVGTIISKSFSGIPYKGKIIKPYDGRYY